MNDLLALELKKLVSKKYSLIFFLATCIIFPVIFIPLTKLSIASGEVSEGSFLETIPYNIIKFSQSTFFMPVWILIFMGLEFSNGHVNRIAFFKSRKFYFLAKVGYCALIALIFSLLGSSALLVSIVSSGYSSISIWQSFSIEFFLTILITSFCYALFLLLFVFVIRSPFVSFVSFIGWQIVEGIGYIAVYRFYDIKLSWLPIQQILQLYALQDNSGKAIYRSILSNPEPTMVTLLFFAALTLGLYYYFIKSDLKPLSD